MRDRFDAAVVALGSIEGFSDEERETVIDILRFGHARVAGRGPAALLSFPADRGFTWPAFDVWQAFFTASGAFPAAWEGLHVVPPLGVDAAVREAYQQRKLDLLFEWLEALARRSSALAHFTQRGIRARSVRQGDGQHCRVCDSFTSHEVDHRGDMLPPFHPGCRCVLLAMNRAEERTRKSAPLRSRAR